MKVLLELLVFCVPKMCQPSYRVEQQEERYFLVNRKGKKIVSDTGNRTRALPALYSELTLQMRAANPSH
jgi:hypothetical protein